MQKDIGRVTCIRMLRRSIGEVAWADRPRGLGETIVHVVHSSRGRSPGRTHRVREVGAGSSASSSACDAPVNSRQIEHSRRAAHSAPDSDNTASSQRKSRHVRGVRERSSASETVASTASDPANNSGPTSSRQSVLSTQRRGSRRSCPRLSTRSPHAAIAYIIHIMRSDVAVDARFADAAISRAPSDDSASPPRRNRCRFTNAVVRPLVRALSSAGSPHARDARSLVPTTSRLVRGR